MGLPRWNQIGEEDTRNSPASPFLLRASLASFFSSPNSWRPADTRAWGTWPAWPAGVIVLRIAKQGLELTVNWPRAAQELQQGHKPTMTWGIKGESGTATEEEKTQASETWQLRPEPARRQGLGAGARPASGVDRATCPWLTVTGPSASL